MTVAQGTFDGIDEGAFVDIHGVSQWLVLRGADRRNPALMIVGGPGAAFSALAPFFAAWERHFTLVHWDQPGAGATFGKNGDSATGPLSIERLVIDGVRAAEVACAVLGVRRLALLCLSGGTIVGLNMIKRRPELFSAYVGSGQIVDWARQDAASYELLLARARTSGDAAMLAELEKVGPPPYADTATDAIKSKYAGAPTPLEAAAFADLMPLFFAAVQGQPADARYLAHGVPLPDARAQSLAVYDRLRADIVGFDARKLGARFEVPMFFLQGDADAFTVTSEVERYVADIAAPHKQLVLVAGGGHSAFLLRAAFLDALCTHVRPWLETERP